MKGETDPTQITENFQLEVNYAYKNYNQRNINEYFLIDIVSFQLVDEFLNALEKDVTSVKYMLFP